MSVGRNIKVGTALALIGEAFALPFRVVVYYLSISPLAFASSLVTVGGILVLVAAIFMYIDSQHHLFWGAAVLFSSTLGLLAAGMVEYATVNITLTETIASILGAVGGALGIAQI